MNLPTRLRPAAFAPFATDVAAFVLAVVIGGTATEATHVGRTSYADLNDVIGLAACVLLFWRRRAPLAVAAATIVMSAAAPFAGGAAVVGLFTVAANRGGRAPIVIGLMAAAAGTIGALAFPDESIDRWVGVLLGLLFVAATFGWGLAVRGKRERLLALTERAERLESEQLARLAEARRAERASIAAEMHDVLAHRLSMLSLHAGAIELHPDAPPAQLANAARVIRASAHDAIEDLRAVMGVLRNDGASPDATALAPQPTIADLGALVAECRNAGMHVELTMHHGAGAVPAEIGRHVYRIIQEGLTNARKHAAGAPVTVVLDGDPQRGVSIEVTNRLATGEQSTLAPGTGMGLVGLRERVELLRGKLTATVDAGAHRLHAWLPWPS